MRHLQGSAGIAPAGGCTGFPLLRQPIHSLLIADRCSEESAMRPLVSLLVFCCLTTRAFAGEIVWLEGETPTRSNHKFASAGWGNKNYLSDEKWLFGSVDADKVEKTIPADGVHGEYDFSV